MKKRFLNIREIEKVVLNADTDIARIMVIKENHEKVYELEHNYGVVNKVYEVITNALLEGKQYIEIEL